MDNNFNDIIKNIKIPKWTEVLRHYRFWYYKFINVSWKKLYWEYLTDFLDLLHDLIQKFDDVELTTHEEEWFYFICIIVKI